MWRLKFLFCMLVELIVMICLPFGDTAARFILWLREKTETW